MKLCYKCSSETETGSAWKGGAVWELSSRDRKTQSSTERVERGMWGAGIVWTEGKLFLLCSAFASSASSIELHPHLDKTSALLSPNATWVIHSKEQICKQWPKTRKSIKCITARKRKVNFRVQNPCRDKELLSNTRCNPVNFNFNDGSEGFKNAAKAQEKTEERNLPWNGLANRFSGTFFGRKHEWLPRQGSPSNCYSQLAWQQWWKLVSDLAQISEETAKATQ